MKEYCTEGYATLAARHTRCYGMVGTVVAEDCPDKGIRNHIEIRPFKGMFDW